MWYHIFPRNGRLTGIWNPGQGSGVGGVEPSGPGFQMPDILTPFMRGTRASLTNLDTPEFVNSPAFYALLIYIIIMHKTGPFTRSGI